MRKIFVIGRHRSGTTWMTNILASHPNVFTPQHRLHQGQHESAFFSSLLPYCHMGKTESDRRAISAIFERSDYWHLLFENGSPDLDIEKEGVYGYFSKSMDMAAEQKGCTHWVEKTPRHTLCLPILLKEYPDASFVAVERSRIETVRSNVYKFGDPKNPVDWVKAAIWGEIYSKIIKKNRASILIVRYSDLQNKYDDTLKKILNYVGLECDSGIYSQWAPDSSFDGTSPDVALSKRVLIGVVKILFGFIPCSIVQSMALAL